MNNADQYVILDASALITLLSEEKGYEVVASILPKSIMSSVNVAEVAKFLIEKRGLSKEEVSNIIHSLIEKIMPFDTKTSSNKCCYYYPNKKLRVVTWRSGMPCSCDINRLYSL